MTQALSTRRERAEALVESAHSWPRGTDRTTGQAVWYVPSQSVTGKFHAVRTTGCDCQDYARGHRCMHLLAVDLLRAQVRQTPGYQRAAARWSAPFDRSRSVAALAERYESIWGEAA